MVLSSKGKDSKCNVWQTMQDNVDMIIFYTEYRKCVYQNFFRAHRKRSLTGTVNKTGSYEVVSLNIQIHF